MAPGVRPAKPMFSWDWKSSLFSSLFLVIPLMVSSCAATFSPTPIDEVPFKSRAQIQTKGGLTVTAAVPTSEEANAIYGVDLASKDMQPVWLEVENNSDRLVYFLRTGLDPEYFSPREVAFAFYGSMSGEDKKRLVQHIESLDFRDPIGPRSTVSGFVFTNEDQETKFVSVDLLSRGWSSHLTLLVPIPERSLSEMCCVCG